MIKVSHIKNADVPEIREYCHNNFGPEGYRWWFDFADIWAQRIFFELDEDKEKFLAFFYLKYPNERRQEPDL